jgi:mitochondrial fission protein ELM1
MRREDRVGPMKGPVEQQGEHQGKNPVGNLAGKTVWVMTDGKAGMENQCLGLAEALVALGGKAPVVKRLAPRFPWSSLPPQFWFSPLSTPDFDGEPLTPPWPDILIATGRQTVAPALAIKRASGGSTFCVQIQNPAWRHDAFDLLAIPKHDGVTGANVIETFGALHRVTPSILSTEAEKFRATVAGLPHPLIAVLIGGSNKQYRMTDAVTRRLGANLRTLCNDHGAGLAITASRRTGAENEKHLRTALADAPCWFWDGRGDNPYFGLLGLADAIVVTADSVSMVSEAGATGKPVHIIELDGGSAKFARFHDGLRAAGMTRPFDGALETWTYDTPDDTARVAAEIVRRLSA